MCYVAICTDSNRPTQNTAKKKAENFNNLFGLNEIRTRAATSTAIGAPTGNATLATVSCFVFVECKRVTTTNMLQFGSMTLLGHRDRNPVHSEKI